MEEERTLYGNGAFSLAALRIPTLVISRSVKGAFASHSSTFNTGLACGVLRTGAVPLRCAGRAAAIETNLVHCWPSASRPNITFYKANCNSRSSPHSDWPQKVLDAAV